MVIPTLPSGMTVPLTADITNFSALPLPSSALSLGLVPVTSKRKYEFGPTRTSRGVDATFVERPTLPVVKKLALILRRTLDVTDPPLTSNTFTVPVAALKRDPEKPATEDTYRSDDGHWDCSPTPRALFGAVAIQTMGVLLFVSNEKLPLVRVAKAVPLALVAHTAWWSTPTILIFWLGLSEATMVRGATVSAAAVPMAILPATLPGPVTTLNGPPTVPDVT